MARAPALLSHRRWLYIEVMGHLSDDRRRCGRVDQGALAPGRTLRVGGSADRLPDSYTDPQLAGFAPCRRRGALRRDTRGSRDGGFHDVELSRTSQSSVRADRGLLQEGGLEDLLVLHFGFHSSGRDGNLYFASPIRVPRLSPRLAPTSSSDRWTAAARGVLFPARRCYRGAPPGAVPRAGAGVDPMTLELSSRAPAGVLTASRDGVLLEGD